MRAALIRTIETYQYLLSKQMFGYRYNPCVFHPTCSEYSKSAIKKYGPLKGAQLSIIRIFRCHPWQKERVDILK